jgi:hypothetical protein
MENLQTTPRNELFGRFADILKQGKNAANQYAMKDWVPLIGGTGLGDMFMGKAPELVDDISYDGLQAAIRGGNAATGGIGTYGARPAVADAALLGMDAAGLAKGLGALAKGGGRAITNRLTEGATDASRREFMKKAGALAGSTAAGGTGLGLLRKFGDNAVVDVAPKIADNVAAQAAKKYKFNTINDYIDHARIMADENLGTYAREMGGFSDREYENFIEDGLYDELQSIFKQDERAYINAKDIKSGYLRLDNPDPNALAPLDYFSPQAKQEMKELKGNVANLHSQYGQSSPDDWAKWLANSDDAHQTNQILKDMQLNINPME